MDRVLIRKLIILLTMLISIGVLAYISFTRKDLLYQALFHLQDALRDGAELRTEILSFGSLAPLFFMALQIMQVLLAPIPGEASGILGGYLFGALPGFIYSSIGLTIGSFIAFIMGRFLGDLFKKKFAKTRTYQKFNHLVERGDFAIPFILFLFPGFPKDSLSYLLGFSEMPLPAFLFVATVGRMPGTLMLSMQGAQIYEGNLVRFLVLLAISAAVTLPCWYYRKGLHRWLDKKSAQAISTDTSKSTDWSK